MASAVRPPAAEPSRGLGEVRLAALPELQPGAAAGLAHSHSPLLLGAQLLAAVLSQLSPGHSAVGLGVVRFLGLRCCFGYYEPGRDGVWLQRVASGCGLLASGQPDHFHSQAVPQGPRSSGGLRRGLLSRQQLAYSS